MRFMLLMIPNVPDNATDWMPDAKAVAAMTKYNEALSKAGALLALDGLHPTANGARVSFTGGKSQVVDGPLSAATEVVGGYWLIQASSKAEAVEWARRCPAADGDTIEVRQVFDMADFPADVQAAAGLKVD